MTGTVRYPDHHHTSGKSVVWVLLMDSRRAQLFKKDLDAIAPMLVPILKKSLTAEPVKREMGRHRLGRVFESMSSARHMLEPHANQRDETRKRFVHKIAAYLHEALEQKQFNELILIAPKKLVGEMRSTLGGAGHTVIAEVPKDLTRAPLNGLSLYLAEQGLI